MSKILLKLAKPKKHSGKYVVIGTENDVYPIYMYIRKEWMQKKDQPLPTNILLTITPQD
jgi:hypothetical protein